MRPMLMLVCLTAGGLAVSGGLALGQGVPAAKVPVEPPADPRLDAILKDWETTMGGVKSMVADLQRTRLDKAFGSTEVYEGQARFLRAPNPALPSQASLELRMKGNPAIFEKYVFSGTFLYEFRPSSKLLVVHRLPPPKAGTTVTDDNILGFVFGMKAENVKKRYHLTFIPRDPKDKWYHYVKIQPRFDVDKAEFSEARLVLIRATSLPRQFWFRQPNGDEITWDFPKIVNGAEVRATEFQKPALPPGWKEEEGVGAEPRVMRNSGK